MIELNKCPSCDSSKIAPYIDCIDYTMSKENFTIVSCETCDFKFTNPRPEDEKLGNYYKSENYISHTNNKTGVFNKLYHYARKKSINIKLKLIKHKASGKKILDIGSGTGEFLKASESLGYSGIGIEPSEIARINAIKNHNLKISKDTSLKQFGTNEFDVITMWHVLEHIPDLNNTIKKLHKIIKKNGKVGKGLNWYKNANREELIIGRDASCDVRVQVPTASRRHCRIRLVDAKEGVFVLENFSDINPTTLNEVC